MLENSDDTAEEREGLLALTLAEREKRFLEIDSEIDHELLHSEPVTNIRDGEIEADSEIAEDLVTPKKTSKAMCLIVDPRDNLNRVFRGMKRMPGVRQKLILANAQFDDTQLVPFLKALPFHRTEYIDLTGAKIGIEAARVIGSKEHIKFLNLSRASMSEKTLEVLLIGLSRRTSNLVSLKLDSINLSKHKMSLSMMFKSTSLQDIEVLSLNECNLGSIFQFLIDDINFHNLRELSLRNSLIDDAGLKQLMYRLRTRWAGMDPAWQLRVFDISDNPFSLRVHNEASPGVQALLAALHDDVFPQLRVLKLAGLNMGFSLFFATIGKGVLLNLTVLDLSRNVIDQGAGQAFVNAIKPLVVRGEQGYTFASGSLPNSYISIQGVRVTLNSDFFEKISMLTKGIKRGEVSVVRLIYSQLMAIEQG